MNIAGYPRVPDASQAAVPSDDVATVVTQLRQVSQAIRSVAKPLDALAEAALELIEASSFILEAMTTLPSADELARRELLAEALSCTRAAAGVMRFALVRADDEVRLRCSSALSGAAVSPGETR
jgi:hypothetical protein